MYRSYPTVQEQPNRKLRKAARKTVYEFNHTIAKIERKKARLERRKSNGL